MQPEDFSPTAPGQLVWVGDSGQTLIDSIPGDRSPTRAATQGGHWAFSPNPLPPSWTPSLETIRRMSEADQALGRLAGVGRSLPNPHLLIQPFLCLLDAALPEDFGVSRSINDGR